MNKKLIIILTILAFAMALVVAGPMMIQKEDKIINVTIEGSGNISYEDNETNIKRERLITSDGEYRLNIPINVRVSYPKCLESETKTDAIGEEYEECLLWGVADFSDEEKERLLDEEMEMRLKRVEYAQKERAKRFGSPVVVQEGAINKVEVGK